MELMDLQMKNLLRLAANVDINTALAKTIEAIEIATSKGYNEVDFEKVIEKASSKERMIFGKR